MIGRNDVCSCGSGKKFKKCCLNLDPLVKSSKVIEGVRHASRLSAQVLALLADRVRPGVSTLELNDFVQRFADTVGAKCSPLGYVISPEIPPFPKSICTSINNVVCHGIPAADEILKSGDIINCDITLNYDGYHGDTSKTFIVGEKTSSQASQLVKDTEEAMMRGIRAIAPGKNIKDIGAAIEDFAKPRGYGIVTELTGHGIGEEFHLPPTVFHCRDKHQESIILKPGMIFTVEPMLNLGSSDVVCLDDMWTIVTKDNSLSAQFEHTCLVTPDGYEILTLL